MVSGIPIPTFWKVLSPFMPTEIMSMLLPSSRYTNAFKVLSPPLRQSQYSVLALKIYWSIKLPL